MRALIGVVVPAATFLLLLAVGMDLTADDFARLRRQWVLVLTGLVEGAPLTLGGDVDRCWTQSQLQQRILTEAAAL